MILIQELHKIKFKLSFAICQLCKIANTTFSVFVLKDILKMQSDKLEKLIRRKR